MNNKEQDRLFETALLKLKKYWGYDAFRSGQDTVIKSVIAGDDTLVLFPTGGGKSLCYQVPALVLDGLALVISPLVALMEDQVDQLQKRSISSTFINSNLKSYEIEQRLVNARNGMYKLLYCAPERLKTPVFQYELEKLNLSLIAVDEAHCISEWGHDFRPPYREIRSALKPVEDRVRWIALTATATPEVRKDIIEVMGFKKPVIVSKGFERPNLKWWVYSGSQRMKAILRMIQKNKSSGLIYAGTRRNCNEIADTVRKLSGSKTAPYHAGLDSNIRSKIQQAWISGDIPIVVATNAFGMGIDKPDCRYVIHHDTPGSLEAYYQEAGRAGRDGDLSFPMLCYKPGDVRRLKDQILESYPTLEDLKSIYTGICDSFELAVGSRMEKPVPVDIVSVEKRSKVSKKTILAGIKVLGRLNHLEIIKEYSNDIGVQFIIDTETIRSLMNSENISKAKAVFIDELFRIYSPQSIHEMVYVESSYVVNKTGYSRNRVISGLDILQKEQILTYRISDGNPVILLNSARESTLSTDRKSVEYYRNILLKKLEYIKGYAETGDCRSRYLRMYFGEENPAACGMCDNCEKASKKIIIPGTENLREIKAALAESPRYQQELADITGINGLVLYKSLLWLKREGVVSSKFTKGGEQYQLVGSFKG
jgi:ATP-dependent DNA helicase RecQ